MIASKSVERRERTQAPTPFHILRTQPSLEIAAVLQSFLRNTYYHITVTAHERPVTHPFTRNSMSRTVNIKSRNNSVSFDDGGEMSELLRMLSFHNYI